VLSRKIIASLETSSFTCKLNSDGTKKRKVKVYLPNELWLEIFSFVPQLRFELLRVRKIWQDLCSTSIHFKHYLKGVLGVEIASHSTVEQLLALTIELATMKKNGRFIGPKQWAALGKKDGVPVFNPRDMPVFSADAATQIQQARTNLKAIDPDNNIRLLWFPSKVHNEGLTLLKEFDILKRGNQFAGLQGVENLDYLGEKNPEKFDRIEFEDMERHEVLNWLILQDSLRDEPFATWRKARSEWVLMSEDILKESTNKSYFGQLMQLPGSKKLSDVRDLQDIMNWHIYFKFSLPGRDYFYDGKIIGFKNGAIEIKDINKPNSFWLHHHDPRFSWIEADNRKINIPLDSVVVNPRGWAPNLLQIFTLLLMSYGNDGTFLLPRHRSRTTTWGRKGAIEAGNFVNMIEVNAEPKGARDTRTGLVMVQKLG